MNQDLKNFWCNEKTFQFISSLSFNGYILAGHSVTNMIERRSIQSDLDFWVTKERNFKPAFLEMFPFYGTVNVYPNMIELIDDNHELPDVNIIYTNLQPINLILKFDLSYCRCHWKPGTKTIATKECLESIRTRMVIGDGYNKDYYSHLQRYRIIKAIHYGYNFSKKFWMSHKHFIKSSSLEKLYSNDNPQITLDDLTIKDTRKTIDIPSFKTIYSSEPLKKIKNIFNKLNQEYDPSLKYKSPILICLKKAMYFHNLLDHLNSKLNPNLIQKIYGMAIDPSSNSFLFDQNIFNLYVDCFILENPLSYTEYNEFRYNHFCIVDSVKKIDQIMCERNLQKAIHLTYKKQMKKSNDKLIHNKTSDKINSLVTTIEIKTIIPQIHDDGIFQYDKISLSNTSQLEIRFINSIFCKMDQTLFSLLWNYHPKKKHKIIMGNQEVKVNRYSKSYLHTPINITHHKSSYMYSGLDKSKNQEDLPSIFKIYWNEMKRFDPKYNQVIVNWYEDENDFIAQHADCQKQMIDGAKISILSFYENPVKSNFRNLILKPKTAGQTTQTTYKVQLDHGSIVTMCGNCQNEFTHGISKENSPKGKRISISFRQMISTSIQT